MNRLPLITTALLLVLWAAQTEAPAAAAAESYKGSLHTHTPNNDGDSSRRSGGRSPPFQEFGRDLSNPGKGWVMVKADALEAAKIADALKSGDFYASTGVTLENVEHSATGLTLSIAPAGDHKYTTYFIGAQGKVLSKWNGGLDPACLAQFAFLQSHNDVRK